MQTYKKKRYSHHKNSSSYKIVPTVTKNEMLVIASAVVELGKTMSEALSTHKFGE
jgi:hypothetical protein